MTAREIEPEGIASPGAGRWWRIVGASVRGTSHQRAGQEGQDAHLFRTRRDGLLVAAVADGAGSAPLGGVGAALAVRAAIEYLEGLDDDFPGGSDASSDENWKDRAKAALGAARDAIAGEAVARAATERDLATTLIVLVGSSNRLCVAQVGDGAAVVRDQRGQFQALTRPGSEEFVNETTFLTGEQALCTAQVALWKGELEAAALFTDGLQRLALRMPEAMPHPPFFEPLVRFLASVDDAQEAERQLVSFLSSSRIAERTDDDLTLLLAAPIR